MMNVVCNIDHNYVKYCVVTLVSLMENNRKSDIGIHIIASDLTDSDKKIIREELKRYSNCDIFFYNIGNELLRDCPIRDGGHITVATYFRIFLVDILPVNIDKVLYIDCDLIVRKDITELWNTDISNYAIACVEDTCSNVTGIEDPYIRLQYDKKYSYFNAGVILFNLAYWRKHDIQSKCIEFIQQNPDKLIYYDQDVLNAILYDKKKFISFTWNTQEGFYRKKRRIRESAWAEIDKYLADPAILHYLGKRKPWHANAGYPLRDEWFHYLDLTRWKGERPRHLKWEKFKQRLNAIGVFLRIDKARYRKLPKA